METNIAQNIAIWIVPTIFAITLHEVSHGYVASLCGDQTARLQGRLTVNPLKHIDLVGTIIVPIVMLIFTNFMFGWAKPVPVDPRNLNHPRRDMAIVACAGPVSNFLMALFWAMIAKLGLLAMTNPNLQAFLGMPLFLMGRAGIMINIVLGVLNLIPIPPLDGSRVLSSFLPPRAAYTFSMIEPYGFMILVVLLMTNTLSSVMNPFIRFFTNLVANLFQL